MASVDVQTRARTSATTGDLVENRTALRRAVATAVSDRRDRLRSRLELADVGETEQARRAVVAEGLSRWNTTSARALALANGSAPDAVVQIAVRRYPDRLSGVEARDRLRLSLRSAARGGGGVPEPTVDRTATSIREVGRTVTHEAAKTAAGHVADSVGGRALDGAERRLGRSLARVPAGLPVTPLPTHWYVTSNVWVVEAHGSYARFTVRADRGLPGRSLRYVRDGSRVRYDWDGDGHRELVGRSRPVDLEVQTAIVVVVPPGGQGVGDTDGNADERSAGWNTIPT